MDLLPYDLVDHLVQFLPRKDLETITKVACWRPELSNWQLMAEQHLEERYLLDIRVDILQQNEPEGAPKRMKLEGGDETDDKSKEIQVSMEKRLFTGELVGPWDFKKLQYASLRDVWISCYRLDGNGKHQPFEMHQNALFIDGSSLWIFCSRGSSDVDIALQIAQVMQKTFNRVSFCASSNGVNLMVEDFVTEYINRGMFVEKMDFSCEDFEKERISEDRIVSLFKEKRPNSLSVGLPAETLSYENIWKILEHWMTSDGYVAGYKELRMRMPKNEWPTLRWQWRGDHDFLPHPSKRSSLLLSTDGLKIMKFAPWHLPVNFDWIDSVIDDWKARDGKYLYRNNRELRLLTEGQDWDKMELKYGPLMIKTTGEHLPLIAHPSNLASLEVRKYRNCYLVIATMKIKKLSRAALESFISKWMNSRGDFVVNQQLKATVDLDSRVWRRLRDRHLTFYVHPRANSRLSIRESRGYGFYTMSVVPIDPETVEDWNLKLLFGAE
ncbi:hypothetical protein QR680_010151 [Steinernema hermaphroditum]|uniref:Uncharacterized protein n=1 Tax=Steinernema hermaphroditum TaxID=289476 RepID=A0AA39IQE0_9BILA|nr:hypothetical protein QR680_010151 [Steinernema hermaphroditum]